MNLRKALISTASALLASQVNSKPIHNSCLKLSNLTTGQEMGKYVSNEGFLTSKAVTDDMRLHSITTCMDPDSDKVTGLQFSMQYSPYFRIEGNHIDWTQHDEIVDMNPIGLMTSVCDTIVLPEGLDKIRAALNTEHANLNIEYKIFDEKHKITYGDIGTHPS